MDGFIFFLIFIFIIVPVFKNIVSGKPAKKASRANKTSSVGQKNWTQVRKLLQEQMKAQNKNSNFGNKDRNQRNDYSHSNTRKQARNRKDRQRTENMTHSNRNRAIHREGNQGVDNWGVRGDNSNVGSFLFLLLFGLIALLVIANIAPDLWQEITQNFK